MFDKIKQSLRQMIKQGIVSLLNDDSTPYPTAQMTTQGKTGRYTRLSPYGLDSNPPLNSWLLLFNSQGQESVKFGMASDMLNRKKNLSEGEVVLYNSKNKTFVFLKKNGEIDILGGIVNIIGDGTISGDLSVAGNLSVTGTVSGSTITGTTDVVSGPLGTSSVAHTHAITSGSSAPGPTAVGL